MTWNNAKTTLNAKLEKEDNAMEVEIDGQRVRKRSVAEMSQLEDFVENKALNESRGDSKLKRAKYKVQAFNNGNGLI